MIEFLSIFKKSKKTKKQEIIAKAIVELGNSFLKRQLFYILPEEGKVKPSVSHINNGYCYQFAFELQSILKEHQIDSVYHEKNLRGIPHAFIQVDDLHYDSEVQNGIKNWKDLPVFQA